MRETPASAALRERVIDALINAHKKLRPGAAPVRLATTCAELWDDSLELIELLITIEEELQKGLRSNHELDWRNAPPRTATAADFINWIVKEMTNDVHSS
ncbi:hypothetical protein [Rhizobium wuzhouense]|uniref:Carrier domain-containing protein n=1 Tax=Rhizobium wuzhouense TaxID=1986026 RepID=A0ABX5NRG1_9HYPH|nr:hypothetical protein [Rhizobium wuzhouense]PYB71299.1 hypothetical protein DMY87_18250 [Rhizobium wuzhouense]